MKRRWRRCCATTSNRKAFASSHAETGEEALILLEEERPDLVVLDWMLPGVSGIELCRRLRSKTDSRNVPIIMLTARGEETDRIRGLSTGADDYVVKPFSLPELMARVKAILRRTAPDRMAEVLKIGDIELDRAAHKVTRGLRQVRLGPTEFRLLEFLMESSGRVLSRAQLLDGVWGRDAFVDERTVDVHIGRLQQGAHPRQRARPDPHRALGRLRVRRPHRRLIGRA